MLLHGVSGEFQTLAKVYKVRHSVGVPRFSGQRRTVLHPCPRVHLFILIPPLLCGWSKNWSDKFMWLCILWPRENSLHLYIGECLWEKHWWTVVLFVVKEKTKLTITIFVFIHSVHNFFLSPTGERKVEKLWVWYFCSFKQNFDRESFKMSFAFI